MLKYLCKTHAHKRNTHLHFKRLTNPSPPYITSAHYSFQTIPIQNLTLFLSPENVSLHTHRHCIYHQNIIHLLRGDWVHLSLFCCGHHTAIPTYVRRIGQATNPACPHCKSAEGSTEHLLLHCLTLQVHRDLITNTHCSGTPLGAP